MLLCLKELKIPNKSSSPWNNKRTFSFSFLPPIIHIYLSLFSLFVIFHWWKFIWRCSCQRPIQSGSSFACLLFVTDGVTAHFLKFHHWLVGMSMKISIKLFDNLGDMNQIQRFIKKEVNVISCKQHQQAKTPILLPVHFFIIH